ncbi:hypothetical protein ACFL6Y_05130 [Elusimicrobiota bacterium]
MISTQKTRLAIIASLLLGAQAGLWASLDLGVDPMSAMQEESISSLDVTFAGAKALRDKPDSVALWESFKEPGDREWMPPSRGGYDFCPEVILECAPGYMQECGACVPDNPWDDDDDIPFPPKPFPKPRPLSMGSSNSAPIMLAACGDKEGCKSDVGKVIEDITDPVFDHIEKKIEDKYDNSRRGAVEAAEKYGGCRMKGNCPK